MTKQQVFIKGYSSFSELEISFLSNTGDPNCLSKLEKRKITRNTLKAKIIVHCLIKNEENFIWYALQSVLPFVDKIMVWDTGSSDNTVAIVKSIKSPKILFKQVGTIDADQHPQIRNRMLQETERGIYHWLMVLDGDEIWSREAINKVTRYLDLHPKTQAVFVRTLNVVGDIYHKRPDSAGHYNIKGMIGHFNIRFINLKTVPDLYVNLPHGQEGYYSKEGILIQDLPKVDFVDTAYLHTTRLERSSQDKDTMKRREKRKYELGELIPRSQIPEIIFKKHPEIVPDVTKPMDFITFLKCALLTLPRRLKRKLVTPKEGY